AGLRPARSAGGRLEGVPDPFDAIALATGVWRQVEHIKSHRLPAQRRLACEQMAGGALDASLLAPVDAGRSAAITRISPQPHLGDHDHALWVLRDDVDLAGAAAVVALQDQQLAGLQEKRRGIFGRAANLLAIWWPGMLHQEFALRVPAGRPAVPRRRG